MKAVNLMLASRDNAEMAHLLCGGRDPTHLQVMHGSYCRPSKWKLYTATLRLNREHDDLLMFHAQYASEHHEVLEGLGRRISTAHLAAVEIKAGIDRNDPVIRRLVPASIVVRLAEHGDCCPDRRPLAAGGVIHVVEQVDHQREDGANW